MARDQISTERKWENAGKCPGSERIELMGMRAVSKKAEGLDASLFDMETPIEIEINVRVREQCTFHATLHFITDQGTTAFTSGGNPPRNSRNETEVADYKLVCHIPGNLLNEGSYRVRLLLVENGSNVTMILEDVIGFTVDDLKPRAVGSYHGREPGPVRPKLGWSCEVMIA